MRTTDDNGLMATRPKNLLSKPLCGPDGQIWSALGEIGRQLQILASAQKGEGNFIAHTSPALIYPPDSFSVVEITNEFLKAKGRAGRSDRYLAALHYSMKKFTAGRANKPACDVSCAEVENWLHSLNVSPRTMKGYLSDVRTMFNFAVKRGLIRHNPAAGVELPEQEHGTVKIHPVETVKKVLDFARGYDLDICRALAVRYFTGIRTAEVERLDENCFRENHVEVSALKAKTRRRRLVTIQPNLRLWLALGGKLPAPKQNGRKMLEFQRALVGSGIEWPHNVTRHSFVSYHLAKFQNAGKTALEAGHTEQMLFAHYREIVTQADGEKFFEITPG